MKKPIPFLALLISSLSLSAQTVFDFRGDGSTFDNPASVGVSQTVDCITLTTVDIIGFHATTEALVSSSGTSGDLFHRTNVAASNSALGINSALGSDDSGSFEPGEAWVVDFDTDILFESILFSSVTGADEMTVTILDGSNEGAGRSFAYMDVSSVTFNQSIVAGTDIKFEMTAGGASRVREFTVSAVPEPSQFALLAGLMVIAMAAIRRRMRSN